MKRTRSLLNSLLSLVLVLGLMPLPAYAEITPQQASDDQSGTAALSLSGTGTESDPYQIGTAQDLAAFRDAVNAGSTTICGQLTDDIDLSDLSGEWTPMGNSDYYYTGTFDGAYYTVSGLSISSSSGDTGFFGDLGEGATIQNLKVSGSISTSQKWVGGIAGLAQGATLTNCSFEGSVASTNSSSRIAGIAGCVTGAASTFTSCVNKAHVTGGNAGGIVGYSNQANTFENCYNTGTITGSTRSAGIIGQDQKPSTYSNCFNVGEISTEGENYAGIVAFYGGTISDTSSYYTLPETSVVNYQGAGTPIGTKVDSMVGKASDLGSAFVEGDTHPVLAWENITNTPKASIVFTLNPADAQLSIDGKASATTVKRGAGTYSYTVSRQGYTSQTGSVPVTEAQASNQETIPVSVTLEAKTLESISVTGNAAQYYVGDAEPELTVTATYTDSTSEEVTGYTTDWDSSAEATGKTVTVTYGGKAASFTCSFVVKPGPTAELAGKADVNLQVGDYGFAEVQLDNETVLASTNQGKGNSSATMTIMATQAGELSFDWKVGSESGYDWLDIKVNNVSTTTDTPSRSGTVDWTQFTRIVSTGDVVTISYTKDSSGDKNEDTAWLKNFAMAPAYTISLNVTPANATVVLKDSSGNTVTGGGNNTFTVLDGTYSYEASAFGYETTQGTIQVNGANVSQDITLTALPTKKLTFNVSVPDGLNFDYVTIELKSGSVTMQAESDERSYKVPAGDYSYTIEHPQCDTITGTCTVTNADVTVSVTLQRKWVIGDYFSAANVAVDAENGTYGFVLDSTDTSMLKSNNQEKGGSSATMTLTAKQAGMLSFSYKVSTEANYDKFNVTVNGASLVTDASGEGEWATASAIIAAGDKVVFTYKKDSYRDSNDDTVWLKSFSLAPAYGVTFTVTPSDASIVLKDTSENTIQPSNGVYTVTPGAYSYTISAFGYESKTGSITVKDADVSESVALTALATQSVTFSPSLPDGITATPSYEVKSADGVVRDYTKGLPAGEYTYTATAEGCDSVQGTFTVESAAVSIPVIFVRTLTMTDFVNSPLAQLTNDTIRPYVGVYDNAGNYLYSKAEAYETATLTLTAAANVRVSFDYEVDNNSSEASYSSYGFLIKKGSTTLQKIVGTQDWQTYTIDLVPNDTLNLNNYMGWNQTGSVKVKNFVLTPLYTLTPSIPEGATLALHDGDTLLSANASGAYVVPNGTYSYTVSQFGYEPAQGNVTVVDADATLTVENLEPVATKTITFEVPKGAAVEVSHASAGVMAPQEDGSYALPLGETFTYVVSQDNYLSKEGSFTVTQDATMSVSLEYAGEAWDGTSTTEPKLTDDMYQISSAAELAWFASKVSEDSTINAKLTAPINLANKTWTPIKGIYNSTSYQYEYAGTFDGAGYTISGLSTDKGLFNALSSTATVKNLTVSGAVSGNGIVGGIVGVNDGLIENCLFKGTVKNVATNATGGIAGRSSSQTGIIRNCVNQGAISYAGAANAAVNLGGIVGYSYGEVSNCYNTGTLSAYTAGATAVGGIVGSANASTYSGSCTVSNCYNTGTITNYKSGGAVVGGKATDATVTNCYYLDTCGAIDSNAQAKAAADMKTPSMVSALNGVEGLQWHLDSDNMNNGYPVLSWQGGESYENVDARDVALDSASLCLQGTLDTNTFDLSKNADGVYALSSDTVTSLVLASMGSAGSTITWSIQANGTTHESAITNAGAITYPTTSTDSYTLTATLTKGEASNTVTFSVELLSAAQVNENELASIADKMQGRQLWAFQINNPEVTTASQVIENYLASQGMSLSDENITLSFTSAGTKQYPVNDDVNLSSDGTISYFTGVDGNPSAKYALYPEVAFTLSRNGAEKQFTIRLFIGWDRATVQNVLNTAALSVTWDSIKPEGVNNQVSFEDISDGKEGTAAQPIWEVACDSVDIETGETSDANVALPDKSVLKLPSSVGTTTITWSASYDEEAGTLVAIDKEHDGSTLYYKATLQGNSSGREDVCLNATYTYNLYNDDEGIAQGHDAQGNPTGETENLVTTTAKYYFTVAQGGSVAIDKAKMQSDLVSKYEGLITNFVDTTTHPNMASVTENMQMPRPYLLYDEGIFQNGDVEKVEMTSGDTEHLVFNGYQAQVFRPLPGEEAVSVPYTIKISNSDTNEEYAKHTFTLTVQPFTQQELDDAQALMKRVATNDVYWDGLKYDGAEKTNITQDLKPFVEVVADEQGNLSYVRGKKTFGGIELDELPGYDDMSYTNWRLLRSNNEGVIASETLRFTQPAYNTEVTIDSVMTYTKYAQYWEKFGIGDTATDATKAKYAAFESFYKVPVSATVTAIGPGGNDPVQPAANVNVKVTVSLEGSLATTAQNTVAAALPVVAKDINGDGKVTYSEALAAAHESYAKGGATDFEIASSGWVTKLWGTSNGAYGFLQNGEVTEDVISKISVAENDDLYVFTYLDAAYYSDYVTSFDITSKTVSAGESFDIAMNYLAYDENWNTVTGVVADAQLGYATSEGFVPLVGCMSDSNGVAHVSFAKPGTYVLTARGADHEMTAPYCVVTVNPEPRVAVTSQPFAGDFYKVTYAGVVQEGTTPVAAGIHFVKQAEGVYTALANRATATSLDVTSFTFESEEPVCVNAIGDVNVSGVTNIVDAQIAYDVATKVYSNFDVLPMEGWLAADVNNDNVVDASDAFAIQSAALCK